MDWTLVVLHNNSFEFSDLVIKNIYFKKIIICWLQILDPTTTGLNIYGDFRLQTTMISNNDNNNNDDDDDDNNNDNYIPHGIMRQSSN